MNTYRNTEAGTISVVAFCSDFAYANSPMLRYLLLTLYSLYMASEYTYNDVIHVVFERLRVLCDTSADHPWHTAGYCFQLSSCQGDMKWMNDLYGIHDFRSNVPCSCCKVKKVAADVRDTIGDFRPNARHLQTTVTHEEFVGQLDPSAVPVPMLYGIRHVAKYILASLHCDPVPFDVCMSIKVCWQSLAEQQLKL